MSNSHIKKEYENSQITSTIIGYAFSIYNSLGYGYPEKIYQSALTTKLIANGNIVKRECYCKIEFEGVKIGYFYIDLLVDNKVVVELKSQNEILDKDINQTLSYLKTKNLKTGIILAFTRKGVKIKRLIL